MSISEINIIVFPTLLYNQGDTEILRDLLVWKYLQLNNSTFSSIFSTRNCWTIYPSSGRLGGQGGRGQTIRRATKFFLITCCLYDGHWRLTWSLTLKPVGLVEIHTN